MNDSPPSPAATPSLIEFPAELAVKAMGLNRPGFAELVSEITAGLIAPQQITSVSTRASSQGKYLSVSVLFTAQDQAQLERVYGALRANNSVLYLL